MKTIKRIYALLLHGNGLKTREIAKELKLDVYHVADVMFSPDCIQYWYQNDSSLWFAKEGAIEIEESENNDLFQNVIIPKNINKSSFLEDEPDICLNIYLDEISRYRVYSDEEVGNLFARYRKGDMLAYNLLVKSHLRLVANIAKLYKNKGLRLEDLIQEGNIGLLKAIERFDFTRNNRFVDYAKSWILQSVSSSIINLSNFIRIPQSQVYLHRKLQKFIDLFEQQFERIPTIYEVDLDAEADLINFIYNLPRNLLDTIEFVDNWNDIRDIDDNTPDKFLLQESDKYHINSLLHHLNQRDRGILKSYFGVDCVFKETLETIGARYDLTRERTRQLIVKAIKQLQKVEGIKEFHHDTIVKVKSNNRQSDAINKNTVHKNTVHIITPTVFSNYISTLKKSNGGYYNKSYTSSLISKYMKSKVKKYDSSGNLYKIVNLDVLAKLADDILQDIKAHKVSNSYLIALKLYIQLLNEKKILTNI